MPKRIKCPACQTWNEDRDYCSNCQQIISHELLREQERQKLRDEEKKRPIPQFYQYLERLKTSESPIDRVKYGVLSSVWWIFWVVVTIMVGIVAAAPG